MRDTSSDESSSDGGEEGDDDDDEGCGERQAEIGTDNPGLFVFHTGSVNYLRAVRGTGSLSTGKPKRRKGGLELSVY